MITIVTITCRPDPMFQMMADSLSAANLWKGEDGSRGRGPWEWVVIDSRLWYDKRRRGVLAEVVDRRFPVQHEPPKHTHLQGPDRSGSLDKDHPAQGNARNTGLIYARGDYVVFLDDCTMVSPSFLQAAFEARGRDQVIIYPHMYAYHPVSGGDKPPRVPSAPEPVQDTCLRGSGVGYPLKDLLAINGCDEAYCGQAREDVELGIRVMRFRRWVKHNEEALGFRWTGLQPDPHYETPMMISSAWIVEQKAGQEEVYPEMRFGTAENEGRTDRLMNGSRILPLGNDFDLRILRKGAGR